MGNIGSQPWFSERTSPEKLCVIPGLQNLGNNCFLNVILQALASCLCFPSFLQKIIEENEFLEQLEGLPLTLALAALLEELCTVRGDRTVLSPRKVMLAMDSYIPQFNLSSQQDAAESFLHLLSSLREEFRECYVPNCVSLADVSVISNCRISTPRGMEDQSEQEKWRNHFLGPFDGILGSTLTCQSCSTQISLNFDFFHTLPLTPVLNGGPSIMVGCTLEDCLKKFIVAEQVENYHCSHCWHTAAIKHLSLIEGAESDIGKLRCCNEQDSCVCRSLFHLKTLPWSNNFSCTLKQLSIARCPKVMCVHLQRASVNEFGKPVKLEGHVTFPLTLDLSPYLRTGVEVEKWEEKLQTGTGLVKQIYKQQTHHYNHLLMQYDTRMLNPMYRSMGKNVNSISEDCEEGGLGFSALKSSNDVLAPADDYFSGTKVADVDMSSYDKVVDPSHLVPSMHHRYSLVSVVEHFGRAGSGHYTVYRRVKTKQEDTDAMGLSETSQVRWFCISDSQVFAVLEDDVLAAEATMFFYEKDTQG